MLTLLPLISPDAYEEPNLIVRLQVALADLLFFDELLTIDSGFNSNLLSPLSSSPEAQAAEVPS